MSRQDIVFKGTKDGLLLVLNGAQDFDVLKEKLRDRLQNAQSFFHGADVIMDTGSAVLSIEQILEIHDILVNRALRLKKVVHDGKEAPRMKKEDRGPQPVWPDRRRADDRADVPQGPPVFNRQAGGTLFHKGTLRSGQRITFGGNVVVIGDINPGAEIEAAGDIAVMGTLRGVARAGVEGDSEAVVVAFRLEPTQLRIAGVFGRAPEEGSPGQEPEVARVRDGLIVIEPLEGTRWEEER